MNIIFSYDSLGGKTVPSYTMKELYTEAIRSASVYTGLDVILYTDRYSAQTFSKCKTTETVIIDFPYVNEGWWNIGKMYVYTLQKAPFVHLDLDLVVDRGFKIPDTDIICELQRALEYCPGSSQYAIPGEELPYKICCSGIMGGNNFGDIFEENFKRTLNVIDRKEIPTFENLFSVEEVAFTQMAIKRGLKIGSPESGTFTHYQGLNKEERISRMLPYLRQRILM